MSSAINDKTVRLEDAMRNGWVEYWYQPKINLKEKQLVGLETFARIRHPEFGVMPAKEIVAAAHTATVTLLSEQALVSALKTSQHLRNLGIVDINLSVNMQIDALTRLPITGIAQKYCGIDANPKLIFDITEKEVMSHIQQIHAVEKNFKRTSFRLAIDDFGGSFLAAKEAGAELDRTLSNLCAKFKKLTGGKFSEMKLDQSIVSDCNKSDRKRKICENIISLAHRMGSTAVAIGIEKKEDLETLEDLRCDIGQGFLLGEPMTEQSLLESLRQRAVRRDKAKGRMVAA